MLSPPCWPVSFSIEAELPALSFSSNCPFRVSRHGSIQISSTCNSSTASLVFDEPLAFTVASVRLAIFLGAGCAAVGNSVLLGLLRLAIFLGTGCATGGNSVLAVVPACSLLTLQEVAGVAACSLLPLRLLQAGGVHGEAAPQETIRGELLAAAFFSTATVAALQLGSDKARSM